MRSGLGYPQARRDGQPDTPGADEDFDRLRRYERADRVLVVEMNCQWTDVRSWTALEQVVGGDGDGNVAVAANTVNLGSRGNVIVADDDHLIATIGVDDLVIVHSEAATLIRTKRDAQGIKELTPNVRQRFGDRYL